MPKTRRVTAEHEGLAQQAYTAMRQRIVRGEFAPGEVISRRIIATELGISFVPVSEALLRLECDGLLEKRARSGTRVRIPTAHDVAGYFVMREALEVQVAILFAGHSTAGQRSDLAQLSRGVDVHVSQPDPDPFIYADLHENLHFRLAESTGCRALAESIGRISALSSTRLREMKAATRHDPPDHHEALIRAIMTSSPAEAAGIMRSHIRSDAASVLKTLEPFFQLHKEYKTTYSRASNKAPRAHSVAAAVPPPATRRTALSAHRSICAGPETRIYS
jgi:DNA-binding GntR family transcriptional regulator